MISLEYPLSLPERCRPVPQVEYEQEVGTAGIEPLKGFPLQGRREVVKEHRVLANGVDADTGEVFPPECNAVTAPEYLRMFNALKIIVDEKTPVQAGEES